jgi:hypothetical protein
MRIGMTIRFLISSSDQPNAKEKTMKHQWICLLLSWVLVLPATAGAVNQEDFKVQHTENLINLCTAASDDPLFAQAVNFCHGFLVGSYRYHEAISRGPGSKRLVCPPDPQPSRNETIDRFVDWAKDHPEYMNEPPVETEFRFLMEQWPCE